MQSEKQKQASQRNWTLARLIGTQTLFYNNIDNDTLTEIEKEVFKEINQKIKLLLQSWDSGTEELLDIKLAKYKCRFCSKRTNNEYIIREYGEENPYVCKKHFLAFGGKLDGES